MKLLTEEPKKLYFNYLLSAMGSTLITNVYTTVDTICIGRYGGPDAIAAVSCLNPFFPIMTALGLLMGLGGAIMMNNKRGAGDFKASNEFFTLATFLTAIFSAIIFTGFMLFRKELLIMFGAEGEILDFAMQYTLPITMISPTFTMCACFSIFVRNDGEIVLPTVATITGGIINTIGDFLFVFDYGLGLGVFGAGLATAIGQVVAFSLICSYFLRKKCKLRFTKIKNIGNKLGAIVALGFSSFIIDISFGICIVVYNREIMANFTADHLAVYSTASTVLLTSYCLFYACGSALQPIVSANFGANNTGRVKKTLGIAAITTITLSVVLTILIELFPAFFLKLFMDTNEQIMQIGPGIIRKFALGIIPAALAIIFSYYLQSVIEKVKSQTVSLLRGLLLPILFVLTLAQIFGSEMIWYSIPIAEFITFLIALILTLRQTKRMKNEHVGNI